MHCLALLTLSILLFGCTDAPGGAASPALRSAKRAPQPTDHPEEGQQGGQECVFDTSTYKFTTAAIKKYDPSLPFTWNDETKEATIAIGGDDTLNLHIGGCDHFTYAASYTTGASALDSDSSVLSKARWMAESFFGDGFDEGFLHALDRKSIEIRKTANMTIVTLTGTDSTISDHVYEPIIVESAKGRAKITMLAYQD